MQYRLKIGQKRSFLHSKVQKGGDIDGHLLEAVTKGDLNEVKRLFGYKKNFHIKSNFLKKLLLHNASGIGHLEVVNFLLKNIPYNSAELEGPLIISSNAGNLEVVKLLLKAGANVRAKNDEALRLSSINGHSEVVKLILKAGADVHATDDDALRKASFFGYLEVVKVLLKAGANVHANNDEALRYASNYGHLELVKVLLKAGADVHATDDVALRKASYHGYLEIVKVLLEAGANVHANNDEALRKASKHGDLEVVKLLKKYPLIRVIQNRLLNERNSILEKVSESTRRGYTFPLDEGETLINLPIRTLRSRYDLRPPRRTSKGKLISPGGKQYFKRSLRNKPFLPKETRSLSVSSKKRTPIKRRKTN